MLGVDKSIISKHLDIALENIQNEAEQKELREYGVVPKQELEAIIPVIQSVIISHTNSYAEWLVETLVRQFQNTLSKEIDRVSTIIVQQYIINKDKELGKEFEDSTLALLEQK